MQVPLGLGSGAGLLEGIHDVIAAGEHQLGAIGLGHDVPQAGGGALAGAALGLHVRIGEMGEANAALAAAVGVAG